MDPRARRRGPRRADARGLLILGALLLPLLWAHTAAAAEVRSGELVRVGQDEVIPDDLYVFARRVEVLGRVQGDLVVFGQEVDVRGAVEGDVLSAARRLRLEGPVQGTVRVAGNAVTVRGPVSRDVLVAGNRLTLEPPGEVRGDLLLTAREATVGAPVGGEVRAHAKTLVLAAPVQEGVSAGVDRLRITPEAHIAGPLLYRSREPAEVPPGAVSGVVERRAPERAGPPAPALFLFRWTRSVVSFVVLGLLLAVLAPRLLLRTPTVLRESPLRSLEWGALALVAAPVTALVLLLLGTLLGGWWLGLLTLVLLGLAILACLPLVGLTVGQWVLSRLGRTHTPPLLALLLGVALLMLTIHLPVLGPPVLLAAVLFGLGGLLRAGAQLRSSAPVTP